LKPLYFFPPLLLHKSVVIVFTVWDMTVGNEKSCGISWLFEEPLPRH